MSKKLVNKHIVRAISLGLTAVMASSPLTALAAGNGVGPVDPTTPTTDVDTKTDAYQEAAGVVQTAQETVNEATVVVVDQTVELPGSCAETITVPNAQDAVEAVVLETVTTEANGEQIAYEDVSLKVENAGDALVNTEADLIQTEMKENQAKADVETATKQINDANALSNSITENHTAAENAATNSQQAVEKAEKEDADSEVIEGALGEAEKALKEATEAQEQALKKFNDSEAELHKAYDKLKEAENILAEAQESLVATQTDIYKAVEALEAAKAEADLLQQQVNANALALKNSKEAKLKAVYDKMMATAEGAISSLYSGEAANGSGENDAYVRDFGREKANSAYWQDSLEYFKLYVEYVYGNEENVTFNWKSQGEHFAKNNALEVSYTDQEGNNVTKYLNYHLADEKGNISIYEKTLGTETYTETSFVEEEQLVKGDYQDGQSYVDESKVVEGTISTHEETVLYYVDGTRTTEITENRVITSLDELKALLNSAKENEVYEIEILTAKIEGEDPQSPKIFQVSYGQSIETAINDMFGIGVFKDAEGNLVSISGQYLGRIWLKENGYTEAGILETVTGNVVAEKDSVIVKLLFNEFKQVASDTAKYNDVYSMIVDDAEDMGGSFKNEVITEVKEGEYTFSYTLVLQDGTEKQVRGVVSANPVSVPNVRLMTDEINLEIQDEANALGRVATNVNIERDDNGNYTYSYDLVKIEENKLISEKIYKASYETVQKEVNVQKERTFWQERKDTTNDAAIKKAIADVQEALKNVSNQQDAAAKAYAAVEQAEKDAKEAKDAIAKLSVDDAGYKKAWVDFQQAKENLEKAQQQLNNIDQKVKKTQDDYDAISKMLKDKLAEEEAERLAAANRNPGTTPEPQLTVNPTTQAPQAAQQGTADTADATPTAELGEGQQAAAGQGAAGQGDELVDIADEEVPLADGAEGDVGDAEEDTDSLLTIEEEEVPLVAAPIAKESMSWWWLLIVALIGATGYKMYEKHQEKKELKNK